MPRKGDVAVVVNLSPGRTSFHVAGCFEAVMDGPGSGHILPTKAYHRSGEATRRCIKMVYFFDVTDPIPVGDEDAASSSDAALPPAPLDESVVKPEPSANLKSEA